MKKLEIFFGVLRIPMDFMMAMSALFLAYMIRPYTDLIPGVQMYAGPEHLPSFYYYLNYTLICALALIILNAFLGLYKLRSTYHLLSEFLRIVIATLIWFMGVIAVYVLIIHDLPFSRIMLAHSFLFLISYVFLGRIIIRLLQSLLLLFGYGKRRLLFIGLEKETDELFSILKNDSKYLIVGVLGSKIESRKKGCLKIIGEISEFPSFIKKEKIDDIVCTERALKEKDIEAISFYCHTEHIDFHSIPDLKQSNFSLMEIDLVSGIPFITFQPTPLAGWGKVMKRSIDVIGSTIGLILLLPFFLIIALGIKLTSHGPVFYISRRVGEAHTKPFPMLKFRSMVTNADDLKKKLIDKSHRKGPLFKIKDDPRVTPFGKFLRRLSLDELPQLFNVLLGNMSLVGPRPHLPEEVEKYETRHKIVLAVKPGITGLAQISGRSDLDFEEEVRLDRFYIEHWSLILDIQILWKTIGVIFKGKGAD